MIIAGERVGDLVRQTGFEGVTARLWSGGTGQPVGEASVRAALGAARERAFARLPDLLGITRGLSIVDGFRAAIAGLRAESGLPHEATIVGAFAVIAGALVQRAVGGDPSRPIRPRAMPPIRYRWCLTASPTRARSPRSTPIS